MDRFGGAFVVSIVLTSAICSARVFPGSVNRSEIWFLKAFLKFIKTSFHWAQSWSFVATSLKTLHTWSLPGSRHTPAWRLQMHRWYRSRHRNPGPCFLLLCSISRMHNSQGLRGSGACCCESDMSRHKITTVHFMVSAEYA